VTNFSDVRRKFSNHRQWREFIAAIHDSVSSPCSATYPVVLDALRSGRAWFNDGAAHASNWFAASEACTELASLHRIKA
jgi:hypothetical protein